MLLAVCGDDGCQARQLPITCAFRAQESEGEAGPGGGAAPQCPALQTSLLVRSWAATKFSKSMAVTTPNTVCR